VRIFLVRHAKAVKRSAWTKPDDQRPLDAQGERQSCGLQTMFKEVPLRRICSSPALRCRKTIEGLAADHSLSVEVDPRLGTDSDDNFDISGALDLLDEKRGEPIVLCASRWLILELLRTLGVASDAKSSPRCRKGSVWMLDRRAGSIVRAEYKAPQESDRGERRAVLDVGSTSMSLLVADVGPDKDRIQKVLRSRAELRLGASAKQIGAADRGRIIKLGRSMRAEAEDAGCAELISVATASLRNADNGAEIADRLSEVLATPLRVLSGPEEAEIVYQAVHRRLELGTRPAVVIDLGGGSLDLALGRGPKIVYAASEPLGVTRLHAEYVRDDPMSKLQMKAIRDRVRTLLAPHITKLAANKTLRCVGAGGTVRAIARLVRVERGDRNVENVRGISILRSELESLSDQLRRATHAERIAMPGMRTQRADLLPTGAIVLATLLGQLDLPEIMVSDWGLREGMLLIRPPVERGA
jgi:phosphohistidine phosphatase SixA